MTEDRKRLLISIASALVLHLAVLILTGLNSFDYQIPTEYGPLTVELSPPVREISQKPEPQVSLPEQELVPENVPEAAAPEPAAVTAADVPEPQAVPAPSLPAATVKPAKPEPSPPAYTRAEPDDALISELRKLTAGSEGVDARAAFGDDPVPAVTDDADALAAAGRDSGSSVVISDIPAAREEDFTGRVVNNPSATDTSVLAEGDLSSLDKRLSAGSETAAASVPETRISSVSSSAAAADSSGSSPMITFENAAASRALSDWAHPEIPDEIREEGARKYTVVIDFFVDADGFTRDAVIRKTSGKAVIDAAVQSALRSWVFEEARDGSDSEQKKIPATLTYVIEIK